MSKKNETNLRKIAILLDLLCEKLRMRNLRALIKWVCMVRECNIILIGPLIRKKANKFATAMGMGITDFTASNGWLTRFKKRENLNFQA